MMKDFCPGCESPFEQHDVPPDAPVGCLRSLQRQLNSVQKMSIPDLLQRMAALDHQNMKLAQRLLAAEESLRRVRTDLDGHTANGKGASHTPLGE
jgi:hypothetical protein